MSEEIDTMNRFGVGVQGDGVVIVMPPRGIISKDDAILLAAWLVALADPLEDRFEKVLHAIQSS